MSRLEQRIERSELALQPEREPGLHILMVDDDGVWRRNGEPVDPDSIPAGDRVVLLCKRQDGPQ